MIVSPEAISASSAPSTSPLKHCETKLAQLITSWPMKIRSSRWLALDTATHSSGPCQRASGCRDGRHFACVQQGGARGSGVAAELAAESIRLLHQRFAWHNLDNFPEVLFVLHVLRRFSMDND